MMISEHGGEQDNRGSEVHLGQECTQTVHTFTEATQCSKYVISITMY